MAATPQELFTNGALGVVTAGGMDPTSTTFTVTELAPFPAVSSTASPPTQFRFADPASPGEMMTCTSRVLVSGTTYTWNVVRGDEGSTAVAHASPSFMVRDTVTAGIFAAFQNFLTYGLQPYFQSVSITPPPNSPGTYGTAHVYTPPSGYRFWLPLHIFVAATTIGSETLTVLGTGTLEDGTSNGGQITLSSTAGVIDSALLLAGSVGLTNQNAGQQVWWGGTPATGSTTTGKRLASYSLAVKTNNTGPSSAVVNTAIWAVPIP